MKMIIYILLKIIVLLFLFAVFCKEEEEDIIEFWIDENSNLTTLGTIYVVCWDDCDTCAGFKKISQGQYKFLFGFKHDDHIGQKVYTHCFKILNDEDPDPIDTTDTISNFGNLIFLEDSMGNRFGFDDWKDFKDAYDKKCYLSIRAGDSTKFKVVNRYSYNMYDKFYAKIEFDMSTSLSFKRDNDVDTISIVAEDTNVIQLFSRSTVYEGEAEINIYGEVFGQSPKQLSGNTSVADDYLKVIVYQERLEEYLSYYRVRNPSNFNPTPNNIKNEFNDILKQAVFDIDTVSIDNTNNNIWDNNNNENLDLFMSYINVDTSRYEQIKLFYEIENEFWEKPSCFDTTLGDIQTPKIVVINGKITFNWLLIADADSGDSVLYLNTVNRLKPGTSTVKLKPWNSTAGSEYVNIISKDDVTNTVTIFPPIKHNHFAGDILMDEREQNPGGVNLSRSNCSCMPNTDKYKNHVHEFLHMYKNNMLSHTIEDSTNIMYPVYKEGYGKLRYREQITDDIFNTGSDCESQWEKIHLR